MSRRIALILLAVGLAFPRLAAALDEPVWQVSTPAKALPDLAVETLDGSTRPLSEFRGKVVLLSFWATWCAPCIAELPTLLTTLNEFADQGLVLVAISEDRGGGDDVEKFTSHRPECKPVLTYLDPKRKTAKALGITTVPTTLIIDREGRERVRLIGSTDWSADPARQRIKEVLETR